MANKAIDQSVYQALVDSVGEDFIGEMAAAFLDEGSRFLADLSSALEDRDLDRFRRAAHSLKSNAATFGATTLSGMAKELEEMARENRLEDVTGKMAPLAVALSDVQQALQELQNDRVQS